MMIASRPRSSAASRERSVSLGQDTIEVAAVVQVGERIADGRLGHLGVEEHVGDRQGRQVGQDRQDLEFGAPERPLDVEAHEGERTDDDVVADEGHRNPGDGLGDHPPVRSTG